MSKEWLNIDDSPETLEQAHGKENRWWYLSSPKFQRAFLRPLAALIDSVGDGCLDIGCGEGLLGSLIVGRYIGIDGSQEARRRGLLKAKRYTDVQQIRYGRIEDPPNDGMLAKLDSVVFGGIMEVSVKPEHRAVMARAWMASCWATNLFVYDLERLDDSLLRLEFGQPMIECHLAATGLDIDPVKLRRKILGWRIER